MDAFLMTARFRPGIKLVGEKMIGVAVRIKRQAMRVTETKISGVWIIELDRRNDNRGFFARAWCQKELEEHGLNAHIKQMNVGLTTKKAGVRGLHLQLPPHQEAKTVRCTMGALYDVAVDIRPDSPTYKQWVGVELTAE